MGSWLAKTRQFISDTLEELHKCTWPSREELFESTIVVIVAVVALSIIVALVDLAGQQVIKFLTGF